MTCPSRIGDGRLARTARVARDPEQPSRIITAMTAFPLADRMSRLGTESAFEVLARAKAMEAAGAKVIHLEIGEPGFPPCRPPPRPPPPPPPPAAPERHPPPP